MWTRSSFLAVAHTRGEGISFVDTVARVVPGSPFWSKPGDGAIATFVLYYGCTIDIQGSVS
jgi:hypothetical protein